MIDIVIPMAGRGSRFSQAGYGKPKPLLDIGDKPMIKLVIENLKPSQPHRFIFICQLEHIEEYDLSEKLRKWAPGCEVISVREVTKGAACTVLLAREFINGDNPLMIANSDQWVKTNIDDYIAYLNDSEFDGLIMTMLDHNEKWSYAKIGKDRVVSRVVEKEVISDEATVGIYNFKKGRFFVAAAEEMIKRNDMSKGEFYVAPVYNYMLSSGLKSSVFNIGKASETMFGLGVPEDYESFLELRPDQGSFK